MSPELRIALAAAGCCVVGCSLTQSLDDLKGRDAATAGTGAGGASGGTSGNGGGGTGGNEDDAGDADAPPPDPCREDPQCASCCGNTHSQGQSEFVAAIQACVCALQMECAMVCYDYCNSGSISSACSECIALQSVQNCLSSTCASAECKAYLFCKSGCS